MNDRQLANFIAIADNGSFNKAAQSCFTSPQALMQQINLLEQEVGTKLLVRNSRGVTLTAAGQRFYTGARQIVELARSLVSSSRNAKDEPAGVIRIGMQVLPMLLPKISLEFSRRYPTIEQQFVNVSRNGWLTSLLDESCDVLEYENVPGLSDLGVRFSPLVREPRWCIVSPLHPYATQESISPRDLVGQRVIVHDMAWLSKLKKRLQVEAPLVQLEEVPCDTFTVFDTCINGGIYLAPRRYCAQFAPLVALPLDIGLEWDFGIAYRQNHSQSVDMFLEVARDVYSDELPERAREYGRLHVA